MNKEEESVKTGNGAGDRTPLGAEEDAVNELINSESRTPLKTPSKETEVKFIITDSANGDAKIDIHSVKAGFAGMSKDELLKYVNDPFWVRARTILFVLFWAIWIGMFIAAIAIIVMAPRCEPPAPRKWFQEGPLIDVKLPESAESFDVLTEKLDYFSGLEVKGIILSSFLKQDAKQNVVDFKSVSESYGTLDALKKLLAEAKKKAIRILLSLEPNHSSLEHEWFNKSVAKEAPYDSYYVWAPPAGYSDDGTPKTPNNWLSVTGGSAWTWNPTRKEFFLHQFDENKPDLNFGNEKVLSEITDVLTHWLSLGVSGFNLDKVQYLLEDPGLGDEVIADLPGPTADQYEFWAHHRTFNRPGTSELLSAWKDLTHASTENDGILIITGEVPMAVNMNQTSNQAPDLVRVGALTRDLVGKLDARELAHCLETRGLTKSVDTASSWPALDSVGGRSAASLGTSAVDPLNMVTLLLPGTPITQLGDEQGLTSEELSVWWSNSSAKLGIEAGSHYSIYKALVGKRDSHSVLYGAVNVTVLNETAFVLTRWQAGHPGYVGVWNSSPGNLTVDLTELEQLPGELTVLVSGDASALPVNARVATQHVALPPDVAAVFTFVPAG